MGGGLPPRADPLLALPLQPHQLHRRQAPPDPLCPHGGPHPPLVPDQEQGRGQEARHSRRYHHRSDIITSPAEGAQTRWTEAERESIYAMVWTAKHLTSASSTLCSMNCRLISQSTCRRGVAVPVRRFVGLLLVQRGVKKLIKWLPEVAVAQPKAGRSSQSSIPSSFPLHPLSGFSLHPLAAFSFHPPSTPTTLCS